MNKIDPDKTYNAIWVSDLHIGNPHFQYDNFYKFLKSLECKNGHGYRVNKLYLNGDIFDLTGFKFKYFVKYHLPVVRKLLRIANSTTTEVIYVIGNHDYHIKQYLDQGEFKVGKLTITDSHIHESISGKKYLTIHGDQFDGIVNLHPVLYKLGDFLYKIIHGINKLQNGIRKILKKEPFSFAHWIKSKTKGAIKFIAKFEEIIAEYAKKYKVDGVIAGHIHVPEDRMIGNIRYLNSGTWCEICSAIIEDMDGTVEVVRFDI